MSTSLFRYSKIDQSSSVIVKQRTSEIKSLMRKTAQGIVEIGHKLIEVKEELPHGEFGNWLDAEFGWSLRTARRFMQVAESFKTDNLSDLNIGTSALYMLSSPSTPETAREEAIERAEQGESISHSTAKEITDSHKDGRTMDTSNIGNGSTKDVPENEDSENKEVLSKKFEYDEETLGKQATRNEDEPKRKGIGIQKANEAINKLQEIPSDDGLIEEGYDRVIRWINNNR